MTKIPVGATIAQAYRFAFGNFLTLVSIVWLPYLVIAGGGLLLIRTSIALSNGMATGDFSHIGSILALLVPFYVLMMILLCMQMVGITQQALGLRQGSPYYYFSFAKPLWRLIGALLLAILLIIISYVAIILLGVLLALLAKLSHLPVAIFAITDGAFFVIALCAYIYALVRLTFLLMPVTVAEGKIGLKRSWQLGRGNFWRSVIVLLSILIPAIVLELVYMFGFLYHGWPPVRSLHATPDQTAAYQASMAAWNADMVSGMTKYWYIDFPLFGIFSVLFYGLSAGAQAFAYRALVPSEPEAAG